MIYALLCFHATPTFKIVHRSSADRALNYLSLIDHREINDHPIEVIALYLASLQWHGNPPHGSSRQRQSSRSQSMRLWSQTRNDLTFFSSGSENRHCLGTGRNEG